MPGGRSLIERSGDLALIERAIARAASSEGGLTLVSGPAGIGKTALLDAASELGKASGFNVLGATGFELERGFPFGVVLQLYEGALRRLDKPSRDSVMRGPARAAASIFDPTAGDAGNADLSFQVLHGLYWLVAELAEPAPLLIAVDDLQWSDAPSLRHLLYLGQRLEGLCIAIVACERNGEASGPVLEDLRGLADQVVKPGPLSIDGVAELTRLVLGEQPSPSFASACLRQTGGYPLYLIELLHVVQERAAAPDDPALAEVGGFDADGLVRHVWRRIHSVGPHAGAVAMAVAVLGESANPGRVGCLNELAPDQVADIVRGLIARGVLEMEEKLRFIHPVVRAAVEHEISAAKRASLHRAVARLLDREGAALDTIATHLLECVPTGDEWVVEQLRKFAQSAYGRGAPETAALALRRTLAEPPPTEVRVSVLQELARAEDAAGDPESALKRLESARQLTQDGEEKARIEIDAARILAPIGRYGEAVDSLNRGLGSIEGREPNLEQKIDGEMIAYALLDDGARARGLERLIHYEGKVPEGPAGAAVLSAMAFGAILTCRPADEAAAAAERALALGGFKQGNLSAEAWTIAAWTLIFADRPERARELAESELQSAWGEGHVREIYAIEVTLACAALRCGALADAASRARTALAIVDPGVHQAWGHAIHIAALSEAGELDAAESAARATSPVHWSAAAAGSFLLLYARAQLRLLQGRLDDAEADLSEMQARAKAPGVGLTRSIYDLWRGPGAMLAHRRGETAQAQALAAQELAYARQYDSVGYLGPLLRIAGLVGDAEEKTSLLRESVELLAPSPFRVEHARSLVELGAALRRGGDRVLAREPLSEGLDLAHRIGAGSVAIQAKEELRAAGARPRRVFREGVEALTPTEARMARLAADGRSNREIAQELYVTLKTVESTLGRAYAKLGISGRGAREALPAALEGVQQGA
jgi:DNA-binding CsgD family transcriptional regulator